MLVGATTGVKIGIPIGVAVNSRGAIYFTNEYAGTGTLPGNIYRLDPTTGFLSYFGPNTGGVGTHFLLGSGAVALSPNEKTLIVFAFARFMLTADGSISGPSGVDALTGGAGVTIGSLAFDCANNIYVTTSQSGKIVSFTEVPIGAFPMGRDLAFGGPDGMSILLLAQKAISVVPINVPGAL